MTQDHNEGGYSLAVVRVCFSSCRTKATFMFPTSDVTRGARVGAYMVFANCLTDFVHLLTSGGEGRSSMNM